MEVHPARPGAVAPSSVLWWNCLNLNERIMRTPALLQNEMPGATTFCRSEGEPSRQVCSRPLTGGDDARRPPRASDRGGEPEGGGHGLAVNLTFQAFQVCGGTVITWIQT